MRNKHHSNCPTAKLTTYLRSFSDIPYAKEISDAINAEKVSKSILEEEFNSAIQYLAPQIEARYKCFTPLLEGRRSILEIAVGNSIERGLTLTSNTQTIYVGTDMPEVIEESSKLLRRIAEPSTNYHLQKANALSYQDLELAIANFNGNEDVTIIHEGLWGYLTHEEQSTLADNIRRILQKFGGIWITPDTTNHQAATVFTKPHIVDAVSRALKKVEIATGTNFPDNLFKSREEMLDFFESHEFKIEEYPMPDIEKMASIRNLYLSEEDLEYFSKSINKKRVYLIQLK